MKGYFFIGLLLIVLLGSVSAQGFKCADNSDRMFRMSAIGNAHGELYNQENYGTEVCFSDFFKGVSTGVHNCSNGNKMMGFSAVTNAHAEGPEGTVYVEPGNVDVCYGNFVCDLRKDKRGEECADWKKSSFIVSLSSEEGNAHLGLGPKYYYEQGQIISLCCESASADPVCDYDDVCEEEVIPAETWYNCPADCPGGECEINGVKEPWEECDCGATTPGETSCEPEQLGSQNCESFLGTNYKGDLGCDDECNFDTSGCIRRTTEPNWCDENQLKFFYTGPGCSTPTGCWVESCDDVNKMTGTPEFKENACEWCSSEWAQTGCKSGETCWCEWDEGKCHQFKTTAGGPVCKTVWTLLEDCGPGVTQRTFSVSYVKISGVGECDPPETRPLPCAEVIQLNFFTAFNFVFSLVAIYFIYFVSRVKKDENRK